ncbi:hypothetical protein Pmar_PMAR028640 [Perkinsus marinus ATCC 50983]|uniref:Uncharacterized protein n=1 Tax=Perkinsus marinus (strain ATCC 50983 / TXsc) TaxID=423536 RepID=C5K8G8_PERM5|nr:hypothetical protein Pmar_PMAR028640 [Perkinsus marinus ATCC 50983]EER19175.1 hypothetical protein Pmar_PMAR028640 [Perkinsus marinus ATCC 50983]|eukprot:XP_002787379.1 hypothetical protein Pmar_PMAR028640 [Perkinsus marinus ATCC 50983]
MARKRGLASIKTITGERMEMFHRALDGYISKGFCAIVKDNRLDPSKPEASTCQSIWEKLSKGTPYQGSLAPLPEHFTASHLVYRDQHPTTPCRIVLDYREANLYSLRGGYPQNSLHGTLLLLRSSKYFVAGDLSKAFCRMQSSRADVPYVGYTCIGPFTVLWSRVGFGTRAAPNMLDSVVDDTIDEIYDLSQLAAEIDGDTFEVAVKSIDPERIKSALLYPSEEGYDYLYDGPPIPSHVKMLKFVDDIYALGSTVAEAQRNYRFVSYLLKGHDLPAEDLKKFENWICKSVAGIETRGHLLGYDYLPSNDGLYPTMSAKPPEGLTHMSKRSSSSILASLYDPLGLIIEQDILARSIWRRICQEIKEWDQIIPYQLQQQVIRWASETTQVCKTISTSRYTPYDAELVLSTDASKDAWGADLRLKSRPDVRLAAKGALYTNSTLSWSIPRKELDALYRGLLWTQALSAYLPIKSIYGENQAPLSKLSPGVPIYRLVVAIDSELTVYRLKRPSNDTRLPAPERRRLQAIRNLCVQLDATVRHIPSGCNPADSVSRYAMGRDFDGHKLSEAIDSASVIYDYREDTNDEEWQFNEDIYCHVASCIHDPERDLLFSPIPSVTAGCCATLAPPTTANAGCYATLAPPTTANAGCYATLAPNITYAYGSRPFCPTTLWLSLSTVVDVGCGQTVQSEQEIRGPYQKMKSKAKLGVYPSRSPTATNIGCGGRCCLINCDGIDVPNIDKTDLSAELKDELKNLARHIDVSRGTEADLSHLQDSIEFNSDLNTCLRRCQSEDEDLAKFRDYLLGKLPRRSVGMRSTTFDRMESHCHLDQDGIIRQRPWYEGPSREDDVDGMIYLGGSRYARLVCSLLCVIYHYVLAHTGQRKLRLYLQRRFIGKDEEST